MFLIVISIIYVSLKSYHQYVYPDMKLPTH